MKIRKKPEEKDQADKQIDNGFDRRRQGDFSDDDFDNIKDDEKNNNRNEKLNQHRAIIAQEYKNIVRKGLDKQINKKYIRIAVKLICPKLF